MIYSFLFQKVYCRGNDSQVDDEVTRYPVTYDDMDENGGCFYDISDDCAFALIEELLLRKKCKTFYKRARFRESSVKDINKHKKDKKEDKKDNKDIKDKRDKRDKRKYLFIDRDSDNRYMVMDFYRSE